MKSLICAIACTLALSSYNPVAADDGCASMVTCECHFCGKKTCKLNVERTTEEKSCFEVECKDICIPPVTFPWECRPKRCGKIRTVKVLSTKKYDVPVCKYSWEVITICPSCSHGLRSAGCDIAPGVIECDMAPASIVAPPPADEQPAPSVVE